MVTVDEWLASIRAALLADSTLVSLVPGGWLYDRQTSAASTPYGILSLDFLKQLQSSGSIYRNYTLTTTVYSVVSATGQKDIPARLAAVLDFKPQNITSLPTGGGVIMITPTNLDQKLADQLKSGQDVTPLISQWVLSVAESRA